VKERMEEGRIGEGPIRTMFLMGSKLIGGKPWVQSSSKRLFQSLG